MKYKKITNSKDAVDYFNLETENINTTNIYYILESEHGEKIISNVPSAIYADQRLSSYTESNKIHTGNSEKFIDFLCECFDYAHSSLTNEQAEQEDGKVFHYNECYNNSLAAYFFLHNLSLNNNIPVSAPICICIGYMTNRVKQGGLIGEAVVLMEDLIVHDWHVWNMINGFIIDLSTINTGGIFPLGTKYRQWERAKDHVFKSTPSNISYSGIPFHDHEDFNLFVRKVFDIANHQ